MKHIVSVSLGSSRRNKVQETTFLGQCVKLERIGTDGDTRRFAELFRELDGKVDAFGIGGADLYLVAGKRRYVFREIQKLVAGAVKTPVVDGSGLKHTLERTTIDRLNDQGIVDFPNERALLMSAVDRYGMAQALARVCPHVLYGDLMFGVGLPFAMRSYRTVEQLGAMVLPIITRLPFRWFYPTGEKQDVRKPAYGWAFEESTLICGDSLYILRAMPDRLPGRTLITQSVRRANLEFFASAGIRRVITTTPLMGGETFATNVMEALLVALSGRRPEELTDADYLRWLDEFNWQPNVIELT